MEIGINHQPPQDLCVIYVCKGETGEHERAYRYSLRNESGGLRRTAETGGVSLTYGMSGSGAPWEVLWGWRR